MSDEEATKAGQQAFEAVCKGKAAASVGQDVAADLEAWWLATGRAYLAARFKAAAQASEDDSDAASDVADLEPDLEVGPEDSKLNVAQTLSCLEKEMEMKQEMASNLQSTSDWPTPRSEAQAEESSAEPAEQKIRQFHAKTLGQILRDQGYDDYQGMTEDSEDSMLRRVRKLLPDFLEVVTAVRVGESFLRVGQICEPCKPLSSWNLTQKQLSEAQRSFGLKGVRQGRAATWWGFARLVAGHAQAAALKHSGGPPKEEIFRAPEEFRPSNVMTENGQRDYQVVVARLHALGARRRKAMAANHTKLRFRPRRLSAYTLF